jgi:hypothetical protein
MRFSASLSAGSAVTLWIASALSLGCSSPSESEPITAGSGGLAGSAGASGSAGSSGSAGASGSAGSSAGGSSGAGGTAGAAGGGTPAALCPEGTLFCDDFEEDALGQAPGSPWAASTNGGGLVAVDGTRAFSGTKSVLATAPTGASYRRAYIGLDAASGIFPAAATGMYGRAMFWLEAAPTEVHWTMIQAEGPTTTPAPTHAAQYRYGGQHDTGRLMANYETNSGVSTDCYAHAQTTIIPTGRWACFEWHFAVATNEMQLWLDGSDVAGVHVVDRGEGCVGQATAGQWQAPPAFTNLYLGWEHYQAWSSDIRMWVDGVAVSTERVGCPAP